MSFAVGTVEGTARLQLPRRAHRRVRAPGDGAKGVVAIPNWPRDSDSEVRVRPTGERARAHGDARSRRDHSWSTSARGSQACACGECALAARYASPLLRSFVFSQRSIGGAFAFEQSTRVERSSRIRPTAIAARESASLGAGPHCCSGGSAPNIRRSRGPELVSRSVFQRTNGERGGLSAILLAFRREYRATTRYSPRRGTPPRAIGAACGSVPRSLIWSHHAPSDIP